MNLSNSGWRLCGRGRCWKPSSINVVSSGPPPKELNEIWDEAEVPAEEVSIDLEKVIDYFFPGGRYIYAVRQAELYVEKGWEGTYAAVNSTHGHYPKILLDVDRLLTDGLAFGDALRFLRQTMVHEVLHVFRYDEEGIVEEACKSPYSAKAISYMQHNSLEKQAEVFVDHIFSAQTRGLD